MRANRDSGGSVNTRTRVASAAIVVGNFVQGTTATAKCAACLDDTVAILGMAASPAAADGDLFEVAEAGPDVVFTVPFVDNAAYQACEAAAIVAQATNADKRYMGQIGFATYLGERYAVEVNPSGQPVGHYIDLSDTGTAAKNILVLFDVEWDFTASEWRGKVKILPSGNQTVIPWV